MQPGKIFENDAFPIQLMALMFLSDPIQDDDVHIQNKNEPFQTHRTTKQPPNL